MMTTSSSTATTLDTLNPLKDDPQLGKTGPSIRPDYCSYKIGTTIYIITSRSISLAPRVSGATGFLPVPGDCNLVVLADEVIINGWLETGYPDPTATQTAPDGYDITIIARSIGSAE